MRCGASPRPDHQRGLSCQAAAGLCADPGGRAGDTVWWHPDVIHGVEDKHTGTGYSNVMYIGAAPACAKNESFLAGQRRAFEAGESSPDFAAENYEVDFEGRFTADMLSPLGRVQMGYEG